MFTDPDRLPGPDTADLLARMRHRRQRRRRAVVASSAPAAAVVLAIGLTMGPGSTAGLDLTSTATSSPTADPTVSATPTESPTAAASPDGASSETEAPGASEAPPPSGDGGDPSTEPEYTPPPEVPDEPVSYAFRAKSEDAATCEQWLQTSPDVGPAKWCAAYPGATTFRAGAAATLAIELCHGRYAPAETATPDDEGRWLTASLSRISKSGQVSNKLPAPWYWARPAPPAEAIRFEAGDCARWTIAWTATDDYGRPLPPGDYRLFVRFPSPSGMRSVPNGDSTITVTS